MLIEMERCPDFCLCKSYVYNRMKKTSHKILAKRNDEPMEYIHTDIARPLPVAGYDGFHYWVIFFDDNT